jgi:hypothetical protein
MILTCLSCSFIQAALEPAGREKWLCFFFRVAWWCKEAFPGLGVQDVAEFDFD